MASRRLTSPPEHELIEHASHGDDHSTYPYLPRQREHGRDELSEPSMARETGVPGRESVMSSSSYEGRG